MTTEGETVPPVHGLDDAASKSSDKNPAVTLYHKSHAYPLAHSLAISKGTSLEPLPILLLRDSQSSFSAR